MFVICSISMMTALPALVAGGDLSISNNPVGGYGERGRGGGWGYVSKFPAGLFVAGSSLHPLNGLYHEISKDNAMPHDCEKVWRNRDTNWSLVYAIADNYDAVGGHSREWLFIDETGRDRFGCKGGSYLPGAGLSFKHLFRDEFRRWFGNGDQVETRQKEPGFWVEGDVATITHAATSTEEDAPVVIRLESDNRSISTQGWRLRILSDDHANTYESGHQQGPLSSETYDDDEEELPWQIISIMSKEKMEELQEQKHRYDESVRANAPPPRAPGLEGPPVDGLELEQHAQQACDDRNYDVGVALFTRSITEAASISNPEAVMTRILTQLAECLRKARRSEEARETSEKALALTPNSAQALFVLALAQLDAGDAPSAVNTFTKLLLADRGMPNIEDWVLHAHARARHQGRGYVEQFRLGDRVKTVEHYDQLWHKGDLATVTALGTPDAPITIRFDRTGATVNTQEEHIEPVAKGGATGIDGPVTDYYTLLGAPADSTADDLKKSFREKTRTHHPDRGGDGVLFQQIIEAHQVLSSVERRRAYDSGDDLPREFHDDPTLRDEVEQRYFPELQGFRAFGDPFVQKRRHLQEKAEEEVRKRQREAHLAAQRALRQQQQQQQQQQHGSHHDDDVNGDERDEL